MNSSSFPLFNKSNDTTDHFSHLHLTDHPPCTSCGCRGFINSSANQSKKTNNNTKTSTEEIHRQFSNADASAKLPPRPPALRRSVPDPMPSPANTFSPSSESPNGEWLRKMSQKWDEPSGYLVDGTKTELGRDNSGEIINEAVSVEKIGEALIIHFLCPCGAGYQILLLEGNCYNMLTQM